MAGRVALITGASAGIGYELAKIFASNGHRVALVARRLDRLQALSDEIIESGGKQPLIVACDLQSIDAGDLISAALASADVEAEYLVNNAGFGLMGEWLQLDRAEQLGMIDVNVRALTDLSLRFADSLARHRGGILNVASLAGFLPGPRMAVYYATKAYVLSFSEALHRELGSQGVRVTALCPGPVQTEFMAIAGVPEGNFPNFLMRSAERVAQEGYDGLMRGRRVVVPGSANKAAVLLARLMPPRLVQWILRIVARSDLK
jgi:short-subunit dehydrogenase